MNRIKSVLRQARTRFGNIKLVNKAKFFYAFLFLIPLAIISLITYQAVSSSLMSNTVFSIQQGYEQSLSFLEYKMYRLLKLSDVVVTDQEIGKILGKPKEDYSIPEQALDLHTLRSALQTFEDHDEGIRLRLYVEDSLIYSKDGDYLLSRQDAEKAMWYQYKGAQNIYFSPGEYLESQYQNNYISLIRNMVDARDYKKVNGIVRLDMESQKLTSILAKAASTQNALSYLMNTQGAVVATSNQELFQEYDLQQDKAFLATSLQQNSNTLTETKLNQETVHFLSNEIANTDWKMITIVPDSDLYASIFQIRSKVFVLVILFGTLVFLLGSFLISSIIGRVSTLVDSMQDFKSGNLDVRLENTSTDEIGILYDNYNDMIAQTRELLDKKYEMGITLKTSEIRILQSQINPHFLYNTLDMINWLGYANRIDDINRVVVSLSKYYKLTLSQGQDMISLKEELEHVGYYIEIQELRYPNRIVYETDIPEEMLAVQIPKITLQPLVENALLHGVFEKEGKSGTVRIQGELQGEMVILRVIDDGIGMELSDGSKFRGSGYGVRNIQERMHLIYGEEYGLYYESQPGKGTTVTIKFLN